MTELVAIGERPATARIEVTASSRGGYPASAAAGQQASLHRASSLSSRSPAAAPAAVSPSLYTPPSANTRSSSLRASTNRSVLMLSLPSPAILFVSVQVWTCHAQDSNGTLLHEVCSFADLYSPLAMRHEPS